MRILRKPIGVVLRWLVLRKPNVNGRNTCKKVVTLWENQWVKIMTRNLGETKLRKRRRNSNPMVEFDQMPKYYESG